MVYLIDSLPLGSQANSKPIETLFLSPPDIPFKKFPPIKVCYALDRLSMSIISSIFFSFY